ncbi:MAG: hypothetical protein RBR02_08585 [Desulfuromonadaceae bacterium]|nr:hypothetical protein [Desulfuromonadaceae bacterium]
MKFNLMLAGIGVLLLLAAPRFSAADPINWNANWNYSRSGGEGQDVRWNMGESYSATINRDISRAMSTGASLRYSQQRDGEDQWQGTLNPSLSYGIRNDLFSLQVGGNESRRKRRGKDEAINRALSSSFSTSLAEKWPQLRLNYSRSENYDKASPPQQDSWSESYNGSVNYAWSGLEAFYSGRYTRGADDVSASDNDGTAHMAKLEGRYSFWDRRLQWSFSSQYNENENTTRVRATEGTTVFLSQHVTEQYSGFDENPIYSELARNPALGDGDEEGVAQSWEYGVDEDLSIAARLDRQDLDQVEVIFIGEPDLLFRQQLRVTLYVSSNNRDWQKSNVVLQQRWEEDSVFTRWSLILDLDRTLNAPYVKIVFDEPSGIWDPVRISECYWNHSIVATGDKISTTTSFERYEYLTNVSVRPLKNWYLSASYGYDLSTPGQGAEIEEVQQTYAVQWQPGATLSFQARYNENETKVEKLETETGRNWSISSQWDPLSTLAAALSFNCSENLIDSELQNRTYTASSNLTAQLLPDWSASLNASWSQSENMLNDTEVTSNAWNFDTTAQLRPSVLLSMYFNYGATTTEQIRGDEDTSTFDCGLNLNYRPSDVLQNNNTIRYDHNDDTVNLSSSVSIRLSSELQSNFSASYTFDDDVSQYYSASVIWLTTQRMSLRQSVQYSIDDTYQWSYSANCNYSF